MRYIGDGNGESGGDRGHVQYCRIVIDEDTIAP